MGWETGMRKVGGNGDRAQCVSLLLLWQLSTAYLKDVFLEVAKGFYVLALHRERLSPGSCRDF